MVGSRIMTPLSSSDSIVLKRQRTPGMNLSSKLKPMATRTVISALKSSYSESEGLSPSGFLNDYCKKNSCTSVFEQVGTIRRGAWGQDYVYTCKMKNISGEGRGKKRRIAKETAAASLLRTFLTKQKKGKLSPELPPLNDKEKELALMLMSEFIDFEKELENISQHEDQRIPIYAPLVNTQGKYFRCKALGLNAVGHGKTKEIARRMAAKLIIDLHKEAKEKKREEIKIMKEINILKKAFS